MRGPASDGASTPERPVLRTAASNGLPEPDRESAINDLGRLMLQGWTMLADTCARCAIPLARSRDGRVYCCSCRSDVLPVSDASRFGNAESPPQQQLQTHEQQAGEQVQAQPPAEPLPTAEPTIPPSRHDEQIAVDTVVAVRGGGGSGSGGTGALSVSSRLGRKLLEGWRLMSTTCPTCGTPLLRSRTGAMLCVMCAADGVVPPQAPGTPTIGAPPARAPLPAPPSPRVAARGASAAMALPPATMRSVQEREGNETYDELVRCEAAVVESMRVLRRGLSGRSDVGGIASVLRALGDAAGTIERLCKAKSCVVASNEQSAHAVDCERAVRL